MSYILRALKKAERDRRRDRPANLDTWNQEDWNPPDSAPRPPLKGWALLATGLVALLLTLGWLGYQLGTPSPPPASEQTETPTLNRPTKTTTPTPNTPPDANAPTTPNTPLNTPPTATANPTESATDPAPLPRFTGHMYFAENPALNRVFANGKSYRQGDQLAGYRIESIGKNEVILTRQGKKYPTPLNH